MTYGVNRAKRAKPRRKLRRPSSGRARAAGRARSHATSTKRGSSARRARKPTAKRRAKKARKAPRAKKARLYTRYDPTTGQKVRVTADAMEYASWPSRKPSKKRLQREALLTNPVGTLGVLGAAAGRKALERAGETAARTTLRTARAAGVGALGLSTAGLGAAAASAAILAAGYVVMDRVARAGTLEVGFRLNAISTRFVETQRQLMRTHRVSRWEEVPQSERTKALGDYKRAIATASAQARGAANVTGRAEGSYK